MDGYALGISCPVTSSAQLLKNRSRAENAMPPQSAEPTLSITEPQQGRSSVPAIKFLSEVANET